MPQIMAEAFARGLVDKIMVEVLGTIDRHRQDGKFWEHDTDDTETSNVQSEFADGKSQDHINYSKTDEIELISKILHDLRNIQIGDSRYVLPPSWLALEKQVKCTTCNVEGVSPENVVDDISETRTAQDQGDVHQITHAAVIESSVEPSESEKNNVVNEAVYASVDLLHQVIDTLESKMATVKSSQDTCLDSISKKHIAVWEEKEEQIIRTIDSDGNVRKTAKDSHEENESEDFSDVEVTHNELRSCPSQHAVSIPKNAHFEEIQIEKRKSNSLSSAKPQNDNAVMIMEEVLPIEDAKMREISSETSTKKKKSFGNRLRKLFRAAFGRRKN